MSEDTTYGGLAPLPVPLSNEAVAAAVDAAAVRYLEARRARIHAFTERTYSLGASLKLHRKAFGWDIARAPANMALALPQVVVSGTGWGLGKLGRRWAPAARAGEKLGRTTLMLSTEVGRELTFRLFDEFLEMPMEDNKGRRVTKDALATEILADPRIQALTEAVAREVAARRGDPEFRAKLESNLAAYVGGRTAAAELVNAFVCAGTGVALAHNLTPGTWGLSTLLAGIVAQHFAVVGFPLGATLGSAWYGLFPAAASGAVMGATFATVAGAASVVGAFAGVVADPLQKRLGIHQRRLGKLVDSLEGDLRGGVGKPLVLRDHYLARVFDLMDLLTVAHRMATAG
ncbi:MAG: hypothetical protein K9H25_15940 [Rhodospirillum sp.]|nr:hypothetical protein [Rhodospirillum sp.]MCF8490912.1 hypothetical protein [Rhodospirillum sp.]MCF8499085.1 hypothetical protein [Rhodospirillum sp.]